MESLISGPIRTCIGCRKTANPTELLRLVRQENGIILWDSKKTASGRGAYLHNDQGCLELAIARRALNRAFKGEKLQNPQNLELPIEEIRPSISPFGESMSAPTSTH